MSDKPNLPNNPLDVLLREAAKQVEKKLGEWQAKQQSGEGTASANAELVKAREKLRALIEKKRSITGSGGGDGAPASPRPASSAATNKGGNSLFKWVMIGGIALFTLGIVKDIVKSVSKGFGNHAANLSGVHGINWESVMNQGLGSLFWIVVFVAAIIFVVKAIRVVPQQRAYVIERLGRFHATLEPGLRFTIPFVDRISAKHDLREVPLDVPSQICITRDNTQLQVDGVLYYQITDPKLATYGSSNYIAAITQLSQTTLRSVIGKLELDKTFEERDMINHAIVNSLDEAAMNWGVKVLRYEIKDLTPPKEILHAMQAQITAEREKRALIAASEGRKQEQINIAMGQKEAAIAKSEGDKISDINQAQGEAAAILAKAEANAEAIRKIAMAIESQGGLQAVNLKVAEQYVAALSNIAKAGNTIVVPQNLTDIASLVTTATSVLKSTK